MAKRKNPATLKRLLNAGSMLSNIAFNLAQRSDQSACVREGLDRARREWDEAHRAYREESSP